MGYDFRSFCNKYAIIGEIFLTTGQNTEVKFTTNLAYKFNIFIYQITLKE